ncbi:hypothetical protein ACHAWX_005491 [Stephanocyclus meneghinianus]
MMHTTSRIFAFLAMPLQIAGTSEKIAIQTNHNFSHLPLIITKNYDPLSSEETCYAPISNADSNLDGKLSNQEYARLVSLLSDGAVQVESYRDLEFELQLMFVYLDCLCGDGKSGNCCDDYIDISGASPNGTPTEEELVHLNVICSKTQSALDDGTTSSSGSSNIEEPTMSPEPPTTGPIKSPTDSPVGNHTTLSPSVDPSSRPTPFPSSPPIESPTFIPLMLSPPSSGPSPSPSLRPTLITSPAPIGTPTLSPNKLETGSPESPSFGPSLRPFTPSPSLATLRPTPINGTLVSIAPTDSSAKPQPPTSDANTSAPTSVNYFQPTSTLEPTFLSFQPSYAPSSVGDLNVLGGSDGEDADRDGTTTESSSTAVIVGILFPFLVIGFAGLFVFANAKRKEGTTTKDSLIREEICEDADEEVGLSRTLTEPNEQISCFPESNFGVAETSRFVGGASSEDEKNAVKTDAGLESVVSDVIEANEKTCVNDSTCGAFAIIDEVGDISLENEVLKGGRDDLGEGVEQICEIKGNAYFLRSASGSSGDDLDDVAPSVVNDRSAQEADREMSVIMPEEPNNSEPEENSRFLRKISSESQSSGLCFNNASLVNESSALKETNDEHSILVKSTRQSTSEPCETSVSRSVYASVAANISSDTVVENDEARVELKVSHTKERKDMNNDETVKGSMFEYFAASPNDELQEKNADLSEASESSAMIPSGRLPMSVSESSIVSFGANASSQNVSFASSEGDIAEMTAMAMPSIHSKRIDQSPNRDQIVECVSGTEESLIDSGELSSKEEVLLLGESQKHDTEIIEASNKSAIEIIDTTIERNTSTDAKSARNVTNDLNRTPMPSELTPPSAALASTLTSDTNNNCESPATSHLNLAEAVTSTSSRMVNEIDQERQTTATSRDLNTVIKAGTWTAVGATAALLAELTDDSNSDVDITSEHLSDVDDCSTMDLTRLIQAGEMKEFKGREHEPVSTLVTLDEQMSQRARTSVENSAVEASGVLRVRETQIISDDDTSITTSSNSSVSGEPLSPKSFLEQAIERGDWHAVGQAAAILSRASDYSSDSSTSSSGGSTTLSWDKDDRIKHFDHLIAKGDWRGVVVAAGQYQAMDEELGYTP